MELSSEQWILLTRWHGHNTGKEHMKQTSLWVRLQDVLYFRKTKQYVYAHLKPNVFGTEKDSPSYGVIDDESEQYVEKLHKTEQLYQNELTLAVDGLRQQLEYNPIIGTAMLNARKRFEDAYNRDAKRKRQEEGDSE